MKKVEIKIASEKNIETFSYNTPNTWQELSAKQIWSIADILFTKPAYLSKYILLRSIYPKKILDSLTPEHLHYLSNDFEILFQNITLTKNHFKKYKGFFGASDMLEKTTVNEYARADQHFRAFIKNQQPKDLDMFTACFYRKPKKFLFLKKKSPNYDGDPRVKFNPNLLERNAKRIKKFPLKLKFATMIFFMGVKTQFMKFFPEIFPKNQPKEGKKNSWADTKIDLAEAKIFGDINSTGETYIITALAYLNKRQKEAKGSIKT